MENGKIEKRILNLTPHTVTVGGVEIGSSGVARLQERNEEAGSVNGIPLVRQVRGQVEGLPEPDNETLFIVSRPIFDALSGRNDLLAIGEVIRDSEGKVIGAKNLVKRGD